ncbi:hypothetical protein GCM10010401_09090 [Rarobacter faecitabidus]|uniref:LPXTG-motif cell wall-anchored protein n=1 Tax=Rarobacter faecitabidus TaxID=13243 RepID=A0A542ZAZ3_RARFA|nr:LPXTG cell wall anchor domain-containing protein [Rarobacter faecitabidus]TQL57509.1 LPXTG-motif cell wall-anchored protein [Rarobacter faecitabidus]
MYRSNRRLASGLVSTILALALLFSCAAQSAVAVSDKAFSRQYGEEIWEGKSWMSWLGSYRASAAMGTTYAWCVQGGATVPTSAGKSQVLHSPRISFALERWSGMNYGSYSKDATHAALSYLVHSKQDVSGSNASKYEANTRPAIKAIAAGMWVKADAYYGPYTATGTLSRNADGNTVTLSGVGVKGAKGTFVPDFRVTVTLSGPATFGNGSKTKSFTSTASASSFPGITLSGPGTVKAEISVTGLPSAYLTQWSGDDNTFGAAGSVQDMATVNRVDVSTTASLAVSPAVPSITTTASAIVDNGSVLTHTDAVTIDAASRFAGQKVKLTAFLRYHGTTWPSPVSVSSASSIPGTAAAPAQTTTVTLNSSGNATWYPSVTSSRIPGAYTWVVANDAALGGLLGASITDYGIPAETRSWANPLIVTGASTSTPNAANQVVVTDQITGSGFAPGTTVTLRARLYQHPDGAALPGENGQPTIPAGATQVGAEIVSTPVANAAGNVTATVNRTVTQRAVDTSYTWVVSADAISGQLPGGFRSNYGIWKETVLVRAVSPGSPLVRTVASATALEPGATVSDTFTITRQNADFADYPLAITSTLWHLSEEPVWNGDITAQPGTVDQVSSVQLAPIASMNPLPFDVADQHPHTLPADPALAGGWWVYTYCYAATGHWADGTPPNDRILGYDGYCDTTVYEVETVAIQWNPVVTTTASPAIAAAGSVGDTVADRVEVEGGKPHSTVMVLLRAYEPVGAQPAIRTLTNAGRPEVVHSEQVQVQLNAAGRGGAAADGFEATSPGYYPWTEILIDADAGTAGIGLESDYGIVSELALIKFQPAVTTMASHQVATEGALLTDQFTVTGLPANTTVTVTHTGYCSSVEPALSSSIPSWARAAGTVTSTVTSDAAGNVGTRVSPHIIAPGDCEYFTWTESIPGGAFHESWQSDYGISTEVTGIVSVTTTANPYAQIGTTTYDVATVTGPVPAGSVLYFDYYRQSDSDDPANDELLGSLGPVAVTGPGDYTSPTITVGDTTGHEYFRERLYIPTPEGIIDTDAPPFITGQPRLPDETTTIVDVSSTATKTAKLGEKFTDTVHLDVPADLPGGSTIAWEVWDQTGEKDAVRVEHGYQGDTLLRQVDGIDASASGDVVSPKISVASETTVYWVEALYVPGRTAPIAVGGHRVRAETTRITDTPDIVDETEPDLPETGATVTLLGLLGMALIIVGGVIVILRRETRATA